MRSSSSVTIGAAVAGVVLAALVASMPAARAADELPLQSGLSLPPVDVDVDVDIGDIGMRRVMPPRGAYAAIPERYDRIVERPMVPPGQIAAMLHANGFALLGRIDRRGWVYTVAVLDPNGDDGRAIINGRTGAMIRFVPALADAAPRIGDIRMIYGPPPPLAPELRHAMRPPMVVPRFASRTPPAALPEARAHSRRELSRHQASGAVPVKKPAQKSAALRSVPLPVPSPQAAKPVSAKPAQTSEPAPEAKPVEAKPAEAKPAEVELKPTQQMPPVQTLE